MTKYLILEEDLDFDLKLYVYLIYERMIKNKTI